MGAGEIAKFGNHKTGKNKKQKKQKQNSNISIEGVNKNLLCPDELRNWLPDSWPRTYYLPHVIFSYLPNLVTYQVPPSTATLESLPLRALSISLQQSSVCVFSRLQHFCSSSALSPSTPSRVSVRLLTKVIVQSSPFLFFFFWLKKYVHSLLVLLVLLLLERLRTVCRWCFFHVKHFWSSMM